MKHKRAVVLLSGGLDSATAAAIGAGEGFALHALSLDYGQRHQRELRSAAEIAGGLGVAEHRTLRFDLRQWGSNSLTGDASLPVGRSLQEIGQGVPSTFVPARNLIFLSFAAGLAQVVGADTIIAGMGLDDVTGYPDCRPEFLNSFERTAGLAAGAGKPPVRVWTPLSPYSKDIIIRMGHALGVPFGLTWSCYAGEEISCGRCDACTLRRDGFRKAGIDDPLPYR